MNTKAIAIVLVLGNLLLAASSNLGWGMSRARTGNPVLPDATYVGKDSNGDKVLLMVKSIPGRDQSAHAVLIWDDRDYGRAYVVDPVVPNVTYMMTPLVINTQGLVSMHQDPTLTLTFDGNIDDGLPGFTVTPSGAGKAEDGSSTVAAFEGSARFKAGNESSHRYIWTDFQPGRYKNVDNRHDRATVSPMDPTTRQASAVLGGDLDGTFVVKQRVPGLFAFYRSVTSGAGVQAEESPAAVGLFVHGRLVVVNVENGKVVARYKLTNRN